ncbi:MAG TPA: DNA polymerase III subunit beta [Burkholderiales bacterium]|jgi:DNA polymerase-3 subunit beta|nr:DNA polymerase III subunit beta [Burkholderiales bacterium]
MKLLDIERDTLLKPLQAVSGIVERRHTLPILSNVLLETDSGAVKLMATDLEIQVATQAAAERTDVQHAVTVSARKLQDILRSLPEKSVVTFDAQNGKLVLKAGRSRFHLQTLPAQDFPRMSDTTNDATSIELPQRQLRSMLHLVQYAMAQQDIRYYLNGLLILVDDKQLTMVATDGHRLAYAVNNLDKSYPRIEVIVPRKAVLELVKLLADSEDPIRMQLSAAQARFLFGGIDLVSKVIDGKFPDYTRVIPSNYKKHLTISRSLLQQSLQRAAILSNEKFRGVRWVLTANSLKIVCTNAEQEEAEEELEVEYASEPLDIGFNITYLLDVLNNLGVEQVDCALGDANSSMLMTVPGDKNFKYVVMPMRI